MSTPAAERAAIDLLVFLLNEARARIDLQLRAVRDMSGAKQFSTQYGPVTIAERKPVAEFDDADLAEWVHGIDPDAAPAGFVLKAWARDQYRRRLVVEGDEVVDGVTGETLPWASVKPGSEYVLTKLTPAAKEKAVVDFAGRMGWLLKQVTPEVEP